MTRAALDTSICDRLVVVVIHGAHGGGSWGDPHFTTLDGAVYTFNGYAEYNYWAVANSSVPVSTAFDPTVQSFFFDAQVRSPPLVTVPGTTANSATVIRGMAARSIDPLAQKMSIAISKREQMTV